MTSSVVVWDQKDRPPATGEKIICWQSYGGCDSISSVPRYLEDHASRIRQKYLAFVHDLGERRIAGKRLVDHLDLGDGFSLWWMTRLAEKSPLKSPKIYDCLRLIALEEILVKERSSHLTLITANKTLAQSIRRLCRNRRIGFSCRLKGGSNRRWSLRGLYEALPSSVQGLLSLRHVVARWPLRKLRKPRWFSGESAIFICSYFIHLDTILCEKGQFHSRQWEGLPKALCKSGKSINWVQLFLPSAEVPNAMKGLSWLQRFNDDAPTQGWHAFLECYLTYRSLLGVLKKWLRLNRVSWRLRNIQSNFYPDGSLVWLWPILRDDWRSSLIGPVAISNCLSIELFDAALADMPRQRLGLYLWENQGWEKALLRAWRKNGHGEIIGIQHSTVPFWHLYSFDDPRSLTSRQPCALPLPDRLAVNGAAAWQSFRCRLLPSRKTGRRRGTALSEFVRNCGRRRAGSRRA